jgi:Mor family transcriptional regulator
MDKTIICKLGRPRKLAPDDKELEIIGLYRSGQSYANIGRKYGVSRQRVFQVVQKWDGYHSSES